MQEENGGHQNDEHPNSDSDSWQTIDSDDESIEDEEEENAVNYLDNILNF